MVSGKNFEVYLQRSSKTSVMREEQTPEQQKIKGRIVPVFFQHRTAHYRLEYRMQADVGLPPTG
jgi:hypothetical protein